MQIGAHVSISGGIDKAIERGMAIGADCIQTFASPPRTLKFTPFADESISQYVEKKKQSTIQTHVFHAVYLVNLANEKDEYVRASMDSLIAYQHAAKAIGALGSIVHVGSHKGSGFETVKTKVAKIIAEITKEAPDGTVLLLENAAGHSGTIGQTTDELAFLINEALAAGADEAKLGLCLDTQHAFASGVDSREFAGLDSYLAEVDKKIGLSKVKVIHVNDSKVECASHRDRHENIGDGLLGKNGIGNWVNHPKLLHLPFILEVPGREGGGPGKADISDLRSLVV
jgi:deoxyribonuclease-4